MKSKHRFHIVTVGWSNPQIEDIWDAMAAKSHHRVSHVLHPSYCADQPGDCAARSDVYFFRDHFRQLMPVADHQLLASLERDGVPTTHNMIMSDRIVGKLPYDDALCYATFLARRMTDLYRELEPSVIIGAYDGIHGSMALAVARLMNIPWFALHFTVIPPGLACFVDQLSPAARVPVRAIPSSDLRALAEASLLRFERREIQAAAYIAPPPLPLGAAVGKIPARLSAVVRTIRKARHRKFLRFVEPRAGHDIGAVLRYFYHGAMARRAVSRLPAHAVPPATPYVLFGLHMQPESTVDVWAPFFSNQTWVIELLARSIPPSHKLLVKIHKSDISNHSRSRLARMCAMPGVELVRPLADTRSFIEHADLVVSIQGTMGLEAALLGRPVIMLGNSPVSIFPHAARIGALTDLPLLIKEQLARARPSREEIVNAYAAYLAPFQPASANDWSYKKSEQEIDGYVELFQSLERHLNRQPARPLLRGL